MQQRDTTQLGTLLHVGEIQRARILPLQVLTGHLREEIFLHLFRNAHRRGTDLRRTNRADEGFAHHLGETSEARLYKIKLMTARWTWVASYLQERGRQAARPRGHELRSACRTPLDTASGSCRNAGRRPLLPST